MADVLTRNSALRAPGWARVLATDGSRASLVLRWILAIVIFPHGAQKLLGWFGGYGFSGTMNFFTETMGIPYLVALLVVLIEFFGPLALAAGLATRPAALGIGAIMLGAIATTHWQHGFFMNWVGNQAGEGFEYHLLVLGIAAALVLRGGGLLSLDRRLASD